MIVPASTSSMSVPKSPDTRHDTNRHEPPNPAGSRRLDPHGCTRRVSTRSRQPGVNLASAVTTRTTLDLRPPSPEVDVTPGAASSADRHPPSR